MDRNLRHGISDKAIQTICTAGVYIIDKRMGDDRRHKVDKCIKKYDRRFSNGAKGLNRRTRMIDIVI